jgi:hypothetical protein
MARKVDVLTKKVTASVPVAPIAVKIAQKRTPGVVEAQPRDADGRRTNSVKSAWKKSKKGASLKAYARAQAAQGDVDAKRWLHNKRVNPSNPPKGIGSTKKRKGSS